MSDIKLYTIYTSNNTIYYRIPTKIDKKRNTVQYSYVDKRNHNRYGNTYESLDLFDNYLPIKTSHFTSKLFRAINPNHPLSNLLQELREAN